MPTLACLKISRFYSLLTGIFLLLVSLNFANAQVPNGPIVRQLEIQFSGPETISRERIMANLSTQVGQPFSQFGVEQDLRALYATGLIANVRIFAEPIGDGAKVTVLVQGRPSVSEILIEGAEQIPLKRVRRDITQKVGSPLSEEGLEGDRQKILKLYQDRNYGDVKVDLQIRQDPKNNQSSVTFRIEEGAKMIVRAINFIGNESILPKDLKKAMPTKIRNLLYFFNKSGRLQPGEIEEDRAAIRALYQSRGFADAVVQDFQVERIADGTGVTITVTISEGTQYRVNAITFQGEAVMKPETLRSLLKMREGSLYTPQGVTGDLKALRDYYGTEGYVDLVLIPEVLPAKSGSVDINYRLEEGVQSYVNLINIQGNTKTKDHVIRRELALKPGAIFDTTLVDVSRERLNNLNYFSKVEASPQDTLVQGRKNLNVIVEEKRTGSFNFGAGFSTIDSLVGFAEIQQTNFDIFNWPSLTGGGQRFRIRGQYGIERKDFVIAFTEPWFLGQKLSFGIEGFYREAGFLSEVYDQRNMGVAFQFRKPLTSFLSARAEYRLERIEIYNVDNNYQYYDYNGAYNTSAPNGQQQSGAVIQDAEGFYTRSAIMGALTWDSRDSLFLTRKGALIELTAFAAGGGLGGSVQDYGISLEAAKYWSLPWDMIFLMKGQLSLVNGWGNPDYVPLFDRLYLGGANNMRGFDFREVGPKDQYGNPIGGNSLGYITAEITFPIISRVRGAFFYDAGFVNASSFDWSTSNVNADFGFGLRLDLPIGPIRLDYGIPLLTDQYNGGSGKFNFNIGYQF